jgi:hypothetical protein
MYRAVAQRRRLVSRIRSLSFAIGAVAVAATAGMAAAFAQAIPGHASTANSARPAPAASPASTAPTTSPASTATSHPAKAGRSSATQLTPPAQPPSSTPAAPVTSSGGS